jgi:HPt (histidine-containing phosphotransfer) domain-containing protein
MVHEIKSSSYTVSAREMAQVCLQLEQAGELQNWPEIEKLYVTLGLAFARVRECLQNKDKLFSNTSGKQ